MKDIITVEANQKTIMEEEKQMKTGQSMPVSLKKNDFYARVNSVT